MIEIFLFEVQLFDFYDIRISTGPASVPYSTRSSTLFSSTNVVKAAKATHTLHLLPPGPKLPKAALQAAVAAVPKSARPRPANRATLWAQPVQWTGKLRERKVRGADVGNRLYANRKRRFKGHRWQRTKKMREARRQMLIKSMKRRIVRFKSVRGLFVLGMFYVGAEWFGRCTTARDGTRLARRRRPRRRPSFRSSAATYHRCYTPYTHAYIPSGLLPQHLLTIRFEHA